MSINPAIINTPYHGILTEGEGLVQLISSFRKLVLYERIFLLLKGADLNKFVLGGQVY
jgi:hypothetical protein